MILPILLEVFGSSSSSSSSSSSCMEAFSVVASQVSRSFVFHCQDEYRYKVSVRYLNIAGELWLIRNRDLPRGNVKCQRKWP